MGAQRKDVESIVLMCISDSLNNHGLFKQVESEGHKDDTVDYKWNWLSNIFFIKRSYSLVIAAA